MKKIFLKSIVVTIVMALNPLYSQFYNQAVAIVEGGEITYTHLNNNDYEITLRLIFDCREDDFLDSTVNIAFYDTANVLKDSITIHYKNMQKNFLHIDVDYCTPFSEYACHIQRTYMDTLTLLPIPGGYIVTYQKCCRVNRIINIDSANYTGITLFTNIPDTLDIGYNSSPEIIMDSIIPVYQCVNEPFEFGFSAIDPDGDSLVYGLFTPFNYPDTLLLNPIPPHPPFYDTIEWSAGYDLNNMINSSPGLTIDPYSGIVSATPRQQGDYVIGITIKEFRDGMQIGEHRKEVSLHVIECGPTGSIGLKYPNVFTPNEDGINDCFDIIENIPNNYPRCIELVIFNRWGTKVYESDEAYCWDGKNNGITAPDGVYYYIVNTPIEERNGFFTLLSSNH